MEPSIADIDHAPARFINARLRVRIRRAGVGKRVDPAQERTYISLRDPGDMAWPAGPANYNPGPHKGSGFVNSPSCCRGPRSCRISPHQSLTNTFLPLPAFPFTPGPNPG